MHAEVRGWRCGWVDAIISLEQHVLKLIAIFSSLSANKVNCILTLIGLPQLKSLFHMIISIILNVRIQVLSVMLLVVTLSVWFVFCGLSRCTHAASC